MKLLTAYLFPLELSAQFKEEIVPIALFFGMFFAVFGLGSGIIRRMPRKPGSMLDEILNDQWEDGQPEQQNTDASEQTDGTDESDRE